MQVQLLVERGQDECIVKLAGTAYKFRRNERGHLVSDISNQEHIVWVSNPSHNTSFKIYSEPKGGPPPPVAAVDEPMPDHEQAGKDAYAPHTGQVDASVYHPRSKKAGDKRSNG